MEISGCILSKFYIKPQLRSLRVLRLLVVSYRNSTSNHNYIWSYRKSNVLYLIEILHQTTTVFRLPDLFWSCILSKFYIKPQPACAHPRSLPRCILSKFYIKPQLAYSLLIAISSCILSKFYIKPQLEDGCADPGKGCILSKFYIKPQRDSCLWRKTLRCILSKFYIKPQRRIAESHVFVVVSYRNSTSNHNSSEVVFDEVVVVSYRNSTSNHNEIIEQKEPYCVVSYRNSTSNHNVGPHIDW